MSRHSVAILLGIALGGAGCTCSTPPVQDPSNLELFAPGSMVDLVGKMSFDFGPACVGVGKDVTFTWGSGIGSQILITPSNVTTDSSEFQIINAPTDSYFVPGTTTLTIHFDPAMTGPRTGKLTVKAADNANNVPLTIALTGTGTNGADQPIFGTSCQVGTTPLSPCTSLGFSNVYFGAVDTKSVTVFNDGGCPPFIMDSATLVYPGGLYSDGGGPFTLPNLMVPQSIGPTTPYDLAVAYSPQCSPSTPGCTTAINSATLVIHATSGFDGDAGTFSVDLSGTGITPIVTLTGPDGGTNCQRFSRDGGFAYEREPITLTFTITNGATATPVVVGPASIDAGNIGFTIPPSTCWVPLPPAELLADGGVSLPSKGASATCDVRFDVANADPSQMLPNNGNFTATLLAPYTALETGQVAQSATASFCLHAVSEPKACVSPATSPLALPSVSYCGSVSQDFAFNNCGSQDLTVSDLSLGADPSGTFSLDAGGLTFPEVWQWADPPVTVTVTFTDQGKVKDPASAVILSSNDPTVTDGGTVVLIQATANPVDPTPDTLTPQFQQTGTGVAGQVYKVDVTPSFQPAPYSLGWYYERRPIGTPGPGPILDAGELVTDGGYAAWLTPSTAGFTYNVCVDVNELPLPDGGNCHLQSQNCTPDFRVP